jgi:hypothetical protein
LAGGLRMALRRIIKRAVTALLVVGVGAFAVMNPGIVKAFYEDIYPSDPARRQALDMCFRDNHKFNRLDAGERAGCYKRMLLPLGEVSTVPAEKPDVNLVDLERAAAQGTLPRNDARRLEQTQGASHSPH